ncbi:MAG TPA: transglutaminase-like domain-containing protein [Planctomycetota bacterium]|nr:transglutaminase-like domain-containing protein [Planctomycetota bacterium]
MRRLPLIVTLCVLASACSACAPKEKVSEPTRAVAPVRLEDRFPVEFMTCHYGVYIFGEKAGFAHSCVRRDPETNEIHEEFRMEMDIVTESVISRSIQELRSIYAAEPPHALLFSEQIEREGDAEERKVFNARGPIGRLGVFAGGESNIVEGSSTAVDFESTLEGKYRVLEGVPGTRIELPSFDLDRRSDQLETTELVGVEMIEWEDTDRELLHLRQTTSGDDGVLDMFLDEQGTLVMLRVGDILEARLQKAEDARDDIAPVDAYSKANLPIEGFEGDPKRLRQLEIEWTGATELLPERAGQSSRWKEEARVQIVTTTRKSRPSEAMRALPIPESVRSELQPDSLCNSDHPLIRETALKIIGDVSDPWRRVELVDDWMQDNVEGSFAANRSTALAVLDARKGDCTEFTVLASGLMRAAGIPTRRVGGVALVADDSGLLYGHAWIEVWVGEWIAVDPTFGEAPADCGHICFGGENDFQFAGGTRGMRARVQSKR